LRGHVDADTAEPLTSPDFLRGGDLFQTVDKADTMRLVPIDFRSVLSLALATAIPFGVVALALVPFDKVLEKLLGLIL